MLLIAIPVSDAGAWGLATHRRIVADAFEVLPAGLRVGLEGSRAEISDGSVHPDVALQDWENHYTCPDASCGNAPRHIAEQYRGIVREFSGGPQGVVGVLLAVLFPAGCSSKAAPTGPDAQTLAFRLGVIAHYLSDVNSPYHSVPEGVFPLEEHLAFELGVDRLLGQIAFSYDGSLRDVGGDPEGFVLASAALTRRDLDRLVAPSGSLEKVRLSIIRRRYNRAVNDVVDLWYSILSRIN